MPTSFYFDQGLKRIKRNPGMRFDPNQMSHFAMQWKSG